MRRANNSGSSSAKRSSNHCWPGVAGPLVDAAPAVDGVVFEQRGGFVEVDRKRSEQRGRGCSGGTRRSCRSRRPRGHGARTAYEGRLPASAQVRAGSGYDIGAPFRALPSNADLR